MALQKNLNFSMPTASATKSAGVVYDLNLLTGYTEKNKVPTNIVYMNNTSSRDCPMQLEFRNVQDTKPVSTRIKSQYVSKNCKSAVGSVVGEAMVIQTDSADPQYRVDSPISVKIEIKANNDGIATAADVRAVLDMVYSMTIDKANNSLIEAILSGCPTHADV